MGINQIFLDFKFSVNLILVFPFSAKNSPFQYPSIFELSILNSKYLNFISLIIIKLVEYPSFVVSINSFH